MAIITIPTVTASGATMRLIRGDSSLEFFGGSTVAVQSTKALWAVSFPLAAQKIDTDELIDIYADGVGAPPNIVRSDEDMEAIREEQAEAQ